jgi:hypothetical protein
MGGGLGQLQAQSGYDKPSKTDTFHAGPEVYHIGPHQSSAEKQTYKTTGHESHRKGPTVRLSRGEIVQVMTCSRSARPQLAFYLPPEATSIVQLVVEKRGSEVNYFVKGLSSGHTVGGAVQRDWLDFGGFKPRNMADEARTQEALKHNPLYIEVR